MRRVGTVMVALLMVIVTTAQVSVVSKIDSVVIFIGQQAHLIVDVTAQKGQKITFPQYKYSQQIVPGVEVLETSPSDTTELDNNAVKVSKVFTLTSFDEHLYAIPPVSVKVNGKKYQGNTLALKVITVDVDTLHPNQFFPPKDVQNNPFQWSEWDGLFWLSLLMLLACAVGIWLFVRLRQNKPIIAHVRIVKRVPPHQKALDTIGKLKGSQPRNEDDSKEYYTKLTDAIREYIVGRFGFNAKEMTSSEIIDRLETSGDKGMIDELRGLFATADLVKFAKYSTLINENDLNLVNAIDFIDKTKQEGQAVTERIVPKLTQADKRTKKARIAIKSFIAAMAVIAVALFVYVIYSVWQLLI